MGLVHAIIAIGIQLFVGCITHNWTTGAVAGIFYFLGREYTQAEQRNIQQNYENKRANMPLLGGMQPRAWNLKSILDFTVPSIAVILVAYALNKLNGW